MSKTQVRLESEDSKFAIDNNLNNTTVTKKSNKSSQDVDVYAGKQLRLLRKRYGVSQKSLAELAGTTFQQIQKYEKGINRMSISRIYVFCKVFNVQPAYFFYDNIVDKKSNKTGYLLSEDLAGEENTIEMINLYKKITEPLKIKLAKDLLKSLAK